MNSQLSVFNQFLHTLSATQYLRAVEEQGRAHISSKLRSNASNVYRMAASLLPFECSMSRDDHELLRFVHSAMRSESMLEANPEPRYESYTNMPILDWYLGNSKSITTNEKWALARRALLITLESWKDLEQRRLRQYSDGSLPKTLLGYEKKSRRKGGRTEHLIERIHSLYAIIELCRVEPPVRTSLVQSELVSHKFDWQYFANSPDLQIAYFSCLPQTLWHDEVMFLRMIHATESCYAGIITSLECIPGFGLNPDWPRATAVLKESEFFAETLTKVWEIFDTMPVDHFYTGFREATGNASAIQSMRFQRLEVLTRGLSERKKEQLSNVAGLEQFGEWQIPERLSLGNLIERAKQDATNGRDFLAAADAINRSMLKWRSRHLGIARKYLPGDVDGTGDAGIPYLEATVRKPLMMASPQNESISEPDEGISSLPIRTTAAYRIERDKLARLIVVQASNAKLQFSTANKKKWLKRIKKCVTSISAESERVIRSCRENFPPTTYDSPERLEAVTNSNFTEMSTAETAVAAIEVRMFYPVFAINRCKISGSLVVDVSSGGESFLHETGKTVQCPKSDVLVRDGKGIIASAFRGAAKRTRVIDETDEILLIGVVPPSLDWHSASKASEVFAGLVKELGFDEEFHGVIYD